MKLRILILTLCFLPAICFTQTLAPGSAPPVASWRLQSIFITDDPLHIITITMYNYTAAGQTVTVSYPCEPGTCTTDTDAETATLINDLFTDDYTTDNFKKQLFLRLIADFSFFSGMTVS